VHHFYPSGLRQIDKNVVFVVDVSESLGRERSMLEEIKVALNGLLDELRPGDRFNVVAYSSGLHYWNNHSIAAANSANVHNAKSFVNSLSPSAGLHVYIHFIHRHCLCHCIFKYAVVSCVCMYCDTWLDSFDIWDAVL